MGVAILISIVAGAAVARAQDEPTAEPPVAPAEPPVAPADPGAGDGDAPADAAAADELGWEPDQRGAHGDPDAPPADGGGASDAEEDAVLTAGVARMESSYASGPSLWLDVGGGGSWIDLGALSEDRLLPQSVSSSAGGVSLSIGGGMQVGPFTAGARGTLGLHGAYDLASMVLEVGARVPLYLLDSPNSLAVRFGAGWAWMTSSSFETEGSEPVLPIGGAVIEAGVAIETWLGDDVTLGLAGDGMLLFPRRAESTCDAPSADGECIVDGLDFAQAGSAIGLGARLRLVLGVHF